MVAENTWRGRLLVVLLPLLVLLISSGCQTSLPQPVAQALIARAWRDQRQVAPYVAGNVHYVGIAVTDFSWYRDDLTGWGNSRDLLGKALESWLGVPAERRHLLTNPDRKRLTSFFTETLSNLPADGLLVIYLGTHHLKAGRLLLAKDESISTAELADLLRQLPNRSILLADVCYAGKFQTDAKMPPWCGQIYAGAADQPAPEVYLRGRRSLPGIRRFFTTTQALIQRDLGLRHNRYSLFGLMLAHCLSLSLHETPHQLDVVALSRRLRVECERLNRSLRTFRVPSPVAANLKPWELATLQTTRTGRFTELRRMLQEPDRPVSINRGMVLIDQVYDPRVDEKSIDRRITQTALAVRDRIKGEARPSRMVQEMNQQLFHDLSLKAVKDPYPLDFSVHQLLRTERGRCASLAGIYLMVGERLKFPLHAVCVPEHIFVRWQPAPGKAHFNIETTAAGKLWPDLLYEQKRMAHVTEAGKAFYMRALNKRQTLATYLSPLGDALRQANRLTDAETVLNLALSVNPADAEAWNNLGVLRAMMRRISAAREAYRKALAVNDGFAEAWNNLANIEADPEKQMQMYQRAVKLKPSLGPVWAKLSYAWAQKGNFEKAWACATRCRELGEELPAEYVKKLKRRISESD